MKKLAKNAVLCLQPVPQTIVSCRDKEGRNNIMVPRNRTTVDEKNVNMVE